MNTLESISNWIKDLYDKAGFFGKAFLGIPYILFVKMPKWFGATFSFAEPDPEKLPKISYLDDELLQSLWVKELEESVGNMQKVPLTLYLQKDYKGGTAQVLRETTQETQDVVMVAANARGPGGGCYSGRGTQEEGLCWETNMRFYMQPTDRYPKPPGNKDSKLPHYMQNGLFYCKGSHRIDSAVGTPGVHVNDSDKTFVPIFVAAPDLRLEGWNYKNIESVNSPSWKSLYKRFMAMQIRMTIEHAKAVFCENPDSTKKKRILLTTLGGLAFGNNIALVAAIYRSVLSEYHAFFATQDIEVAMVWPGRHFMAVYNNKEDVNKAFVTSDTIDPKMLDVQVSRGLVLAEQDFRDVQEQDIGVICSGKVADLNPVQVMNACSSSQVCAKMKQALSLFQQEWKGLCHPPVSPG